MTRTQLLQFLRHHRLCVQATVSPACKPQAAVVGFAVSDQLEIVFDTVDSTRKLQNLRQNPAISLVIGWDEEQTVQIDGIADEPMADELSRLKAVYFEVYPDGVERLRWEGITYVRVRPHWIRYSDFRPGGSILELNASELAALR
jgi:general stress protein 26